MSYDFLFYFYVNDIRYFLVVEMFVQFSFFDINMNIFRIVVCDDFIKFSFIFMYIIDKNVLFVFWIR